NYWTALWFWDLEQAGQLPTYNEFLKDIETILSTEMKQKIAEIPTDLFGNPLPQDLFSSGQNLLQESRNEAKKNIVDKIIQETTDAKASNVFQESKRINLVQQYAKTHRFFHYHLEFLEVFKERGGFDVIVGNPPWVKLQFDEKGIISEDFPEVMIRKTSSSQVRKKLPTYFEQKPNLKKTYIEEYSETESAATFLNAVQNYPLLQGQQTNLYKCIIENGFALTAPQGMIGLVHPEGIYDDPKGQPLRKAIYPRLKYHFQFQNAFNLFAEVAHREKYSSNIYGGKAETVGFYNINNLFHPATIDGCFIDKNDNTRPDGIKTYSETEDKFIWNVKPHFDRKVFFTQNELSILAKAFEDSDEWQTAKLVSIHARQIISVLEKLSRFPSKVGDFENKTTVAWDETNAQNAGIIQRQTQYPNIDNFEMIYSGPHFYVGNPLYKTPREQCIEKADYNVIDLMEIDENYTARTNYIPAENLTDFENKISGLKILEYDTKGKPVYDNWINYYKVVFRKMLGLPNERTLFPAIILPKVSHTNGITSIIFSDEKRAIELAGLSASIVLDFYIKTVGRTNLYGDAIQDFVLGISKTYYEKIAIRTLLLNCLTRPYADLWERHYAAAFAADNWSIADERLKRFDTLTEKWTWDIPLRNYFERRQALIEIDVLSAMALGLSLEELKLIYEVQFPVLQQNEADTWYDTKGNIVFTCSKGLTGVGLDRKAWKTIKDYKAGQTYTHTITKSELYKNKEVVYYAPFRKCDRVGDYERAWAFFN
ncbi:MAG: type II restriction endonuclease subunit M, partial [Saprospiraceae bacterium]